MLLSGCAFGLFTLVKLQIVEVFPAEASQCSARFPPFLPPSSCAHGQLRRGAVSECAGFAEVCLPRPDALRAEARVPRYSSGCISFGAGRRLLAPSSGLPYLALLLPSASLSCPRRGGPLRSEPRLGRN